MLGRGQAGLGLLLALNLLLRLDPPEVVIYVDPGTRVEDPAAFAAREACTTLTAQGVPLPVPFAIQWFKRQGEGHALIPDSPRRVSGMLMACGSPLAGRERERN
jgi:hypothetical protein